ncbi:uncharacterized protein [Pocillopora verrucosa]|uniref:uncharacterized protein isoform X4 n=1 Tax=Pocillopora verrucosa TaxID=203993 RepID=UPI003341CFF2
MFTARNRSSDKETHVVSGTCSCSICQETLVKLIEDATDAKSAVEALARQLSLLESIVLRKGFTAATRSSVRKNLGLVLKKARANKENKAKCREEEQRKL